MNFSAALTAFLATGCAAVAPAIAQAAAPMMVWPIDPVIEAGRNGGSVWLENRGRSDAVMQVRVLRWSQRGGEEQLEEQQDVVASPPIMRIAGGARQMVRLVVTAAGTRTGEAAYRILIDEVPARLAQDEENVRQVAMINFRMRYSLPLFVYGPDVPYNTLKDKPERMVLACAITREKGQPYMALTNNSRIRAQLVNLMIRSTGGAVSLHEGLAGYVLPGATQKWPLPAAVNEGEAVARVNGSSGQISLGRCAG